MMLSRCPRLCQFSTAGVRARGSRGFKVQGSEYRFHVQSSEFRVQSSVFSVQSSAFSVQGALLPEPSLREQG
eukprot:1708458-Rhodomonas_salina.1